MGESRKETAGRTEAVWTLIRRPVTICDQGQVMDLVEDLVYPLPLDLHRVLVRLGIGLPFKSYTPDAGSGL